jgi:hypothetical protein
MSSRARRLAVGLTLVAGLAAYPPGAQAAGVPTGYNPNNLPVDSCFWTGPFTSVDPRTNQGFPGSEITYWGAKFATPPGATLILHGKYAHARFQSLTAYVNNGMATNTLSDYLTIPDRGSTNPYVKGHRRDLKKRNYTATVLSQPAPPNPAPNTLYATPDPTGNSYQDILYRVYVPDKGRGRAGGVPLPDPELRLADGSVLTGQALCDALNANHSYQSQNLPLPVYQSYVNWPGKDPATNPANPIFSFEKFFSLNYALSAYKSPAEHAAADYTPVGTFYNNLDARYLNGTYSFAFGQLLVVRGKLPTTPHTYAREKRMSGGQLREWDMCVLESLAVTATYTCLYDEQLPLRAKRKYVIVVAHTGLRPRNARKKCGVAWLPADPAGDGVGRTEVGTLASRNVIPSPSFHRSSWDVNQPGTAAQVMGPYYPTGTYMSKAQFEALGCPLGSHRNNG